VGGGVGCSRCGPQHGAELLPPAPQVPGPLFPAPSRGRRCWWWLCSWDAGQEDPDPPRTGNGSADKQRPPRLAPRFALASPGSAHTWDPALRIAHHPLPAAHPAHLRQTRSGFSPPGSALMLPGAFRGLDVAPAPCPPLPHCPSAPRAPRAPAPGPACGRHDGGVNASLRGKWGCMCLGTPQDERSPAQFPGTPSTAHPQPVPAGRAYVRSVTAGLRFPVSQPRRPRQLHQKSVVRRGRTRLEKTTGSSLKNLPKLLIHIAPERPSPGGRRLSQALGCTPGCAAAEAGTDAQPDLDKVTPRPRYPSFPICWRQNSSAVTRDRRHPSSVQSD